MKLLQYTLRSHPLGMSANPQRGASLLMVMIMLPIISLLGLAAVQIAIQGERSARNDRDMQIAWQAAEAALLDAASEILTPGNSSRGAIFSSTNALAFIDGCGSSADGANSIGLCAPVTSGKPAWLTVDFTATGSSARTTVYGTYTGKTFTAGGVGIQPSKAPRYIIELLVNPADNTKYLYRVTAMGFGPRADIQAVLQALYGV